MKKMAVVFMLLCILLTALPLGAFATETTEAAEETISVRAANQCGEDLIWSYSAGTLTISGTGAMDDYPDGDAPWLEYKDSIETLVFTGGVTGVGECAFTDYDNLKKVEFGTAMHTIGYRAFYSCDGLTTFTLPATFRKFGEECFFGCSGLREIRCLGPMPSFKASCLWDCPVSVFYPTTNPWPAEYVTPLYQSYQGKIQIFMGDGIEEAGKQFVEAAVTEPITEPAETVPETTVPETTVPETTVPETTVPETVPETTMAETQAPEAESTQPEWMREMEEFQDTQEEQQQKKDSSGNIWFALCLITGTLSLILIGILIFRRRSY